MILAAVTVMDVSALVYTRTIVIRQQYASVTESLQPVRRVLANVRPVIMERRAAAESPFPARRADSRSSYRDSADNRTQFTLARYSISVASVPLVPSYTSDQPESLLA